ncbi:hypothetical protein [Aquihabitans sp. McL0605]|uniref:hypothetical protein n=1 Tax=Aquihabitans sp. McL0605 TaxID=3415671 RepID=UPI003CF57209
MKTRALMVVAAALLLPVLVTGCGGTDDTNSGSRPSVEELTAGIGKSLPTGTDGSIASCIGKALEASDLPDGLLRAIAKGDTTASIDKRNKKEYEQILSDSMQSCALGAITTTTGG